MIPHVEALYNRTISRLIKSALMEVVGFAMLSILPIVGIALIVIGAIVILFAIINMKLNLNFINDVLLSGDGEY